MNSQNKEGGSDSRESLGLKVSELLKALAERKPAPCDRTCIHPRYITNNLSLLKNKRTGTCNSQETFRSRAILPQNICLLSKCQFKRRDHLSESLPAPITASSQEGQLQPGVRAPNPIILAHLVEKIMMLSDDSVSSIGERLKKHETHQHILGVQAWTRQQSCEPQWKQFPQTGPTNEWFFEDLTDLQRKLFLGASKKFGFSRHL